MLKRKIADLDFAKKCSIFVLAKEEVVPIGRLPPFYIGLSGGKQAGERKNWQGLAKNQAGLGEN